jgi:hypothetical protein
MREPVFIYILLVYIVNFLHCSHPRAIFTRLVIVVSAHRLITPRNSKNFSPLRPLSNIRIGRQKVGKIQLLLMRSKLLQRSLCSGGALQQSCVGSDDNGFLVLNRSTIATIALTVISGIRV